MRTGYVEGLYVTPEARSQGVVVLALLEASRSWARHQRCTAFASDRGDRIVVDRRFRNSLTATIRPTSTKMLQTATCLGDGRPGLTHNLRVLEIPFGE